MKAFLISTLIMTGFIVESAEAKIRVVASVTDLRSIVELVGKDHVEASSIAKGTQDPHFIDAKPSYMSRVSNADMMVSIGLGLEDAWLNNVLHGARNPKVAHGGRGSLVIGPLVKPEEIPGAQEATRREGDVHPEGNPHVTLDPIRMITVAELVRDKLIELDPANKADYEKNASELISKLKSKTEEWKKRIEKTGIKKVVTYHKTLDYFIRRMGLELATVLEPKPGIAPSVGYLVTVVEIMKSKDANTVLIENFFDPTIQDKLRELNPKVKVAVVPVSVEGDSNIKNIFDLYENLVVTLEKLK